MVDPKNFEKLRDCGSAEKWSTARHQLGFYRNVGCTVTYSYLSLPIDVSLEQLVFHALRTVIAQYPILSAIAVDEDKPSTYWARLPEINLKTSVEFKERKQAFTIGGRDEELEAILQDQHNRDFKEDYGSRPFWRVVVLHAGAISSLPDEFTVSWIFHHAIGDGNSGLVFHRALHSALQVTPASLPLNADPLVKPPKDRLLPSLEELHPLPLSFLFLAKQQWRDWYPKHPQGLWTGNQIASPNSESTKTKYQTLVLDRAKTQDLVTKCRSEKTTVTAALECIVANAVFRNLDAERYTELHTNGNTSLRRFLDLQSMRKNIDDQIGYFVSRYGYAHKRRIGESKDNFDWEEARNVKAAIAKELGKGLQDNPIGLIRWISDVPRFFQNKVGKQRDEAFEISNIGVFKVDEGEGGWRVGRTLFSGSAMIAGAPFSVLVVTGGDGCVVMGFVWCEDSVRELDMEKVIEDVEKGIGSALNGSTK